MTKRFAKLIIASLLALVAGSAVAAGAGAKLEASHVNIDDRASLQRGAALFMNYCAGCHSLGYQRLARMAEDIGVSEAQAMANLNFVGVGYGDLIGTAMTAGDGEAWFGKAPPDLSLVARRKPGGPDWTYTFLKSFYVDESRPLGWNNRLLANASMPNVLWELQGSARPIYAGEGARVTIERLETVSPGALDAEAFDRVVRDITTFLTYVGEPAALKRERMGVWVLLFLVGFTFLAWLLKQEYWRDVH
ncbi:MAG TPA: cytochrome c1 [Xanthomonadales bacterium]|nr:cytochrome c1 [Xanthomonadales bacterium]